MADFLMFNYYYVSVMIYRELNCPDVLTHERPLFLFTSVGGGLSTPSRETPCPQEFNTRIRDSTALPILQCCGTIYLYIEKFDDFESEIYVFFQVGYDDAENNGNLIIIITIVITISPIYIKTLFF